MCFFLQRAKIAQGSKTPEEKTTNTISKFENNGNRDRMKLTDFNFLMVLGKGSFGKVGLVVSGAAPARLIKPHCLHGASCPARGETNG